MKPIAYYSYATALCTAFCCHASPLYGPLETGMQESQLLSSLKSCKSLEGPGTDAYLSRTGLNGAFKTKKPIGGLYFSLHFDYDKEGALRSVSFYSNSKVSKDEYDTRLKSLYKRMLNGLTGLYGPPMNMPDWIEKDSLPADRVMYMHMWRIQPGCFLMSGLAKSVKEAGTMVSPLMIVVMLIGVSTMFGDGAPKEVYWYLIPFYNSVQCMNGIFSFDLVPVNFVVTIVANLLYALVMTAGLAKIFDSEKIMYS